jgi:hypothetical protein
MMSGINFVPLAATLRFDERSGAKNWETMHKGGIVAAEYLGGVAAQKRAGAKDT